MSPPPLPGSHTLHFYGPCLSLPLSTNIVIECPHSMFKRRNTTYNLRYFQKKFEAERKRTLYFGLETFIYRSPQLWLIMEINSLDQFT